ncbi:hypothetical protein TcCL_NonESM01816 [Trypanosoma cruzi]|nr:hypothetical protein TcCL_NonESM01816 [Trypanosoma cruzi]
MPASLRGQATSSSSANMARKNPARIKCGAKASAPRRINVPSRVNSSESDEPGKLRTSVQSSLPRPHSVQHSTSPPSLFSNVLVQRGQCATHNRAWLGKTRVVPTDST